MPGFASKLQQRKMGALMGEGKISKEEFSKRADETDFENLPEKKKPHHAKGGEVMECPSCHAKLMFDGGEVGDADEEEDDEQRNGMSAFAGAIRARKKKLEE